MKKIISLFALLGTVSAFGMDTVGTNLFQDVLNQNPPGSYVRLGTMLTRNMAQIARANYDFAVQSGSSLGSINLLDDERQPVMLPSKAVITNVIIDVATPIASPNSIGKIGLTANTNLDLKAATLDTAFSGLVAGIPVNTAATAIKLTADRVISMTPSVQSITAGKFSLLIEYYLSE